VAQGGDVDQGDGRRTQRCRRACRASPSRCTVRSGARGSTGNAFADVAGPAFRPQPWGYGQPDHQTMFGWCSAPPGGRASPTGGPRILRGEHTDPRSAAGGPTTPSATAKPIEKTWPVALDVATTMRHIARWVKHGSADSCICSAHHTRMDHGRLRSQGHSLPTVAAVPSWA